MFIPRFPDGEYEPDGLLGSGGMAVVYRAREKKLGRVVAIKVLRPEVANLVGTERFRREITVASALSHPNILPLLGSGEVAGADGESLPYYVMPLVEGEALDQRIKREQRLPIPDALRITREILDALEYAHAHGVIHRDIKPANVLLSGAHAVVADFGLARMLPISELSSSGGTSITVSGVAVGTPVYMSPEQALGDRHIDARTDLFSLGCVLYEMLTGTAPFEAATGQSIVARKVSGMFMPVSALRPGVPERIDEVLRCALAPERSDRFSNAQEFRRAIEELEAETRSGPTAVSSRSRQRRRTATMIAAVFTVVAAIVVVLVRRPPLPEVSPQRPLPEVEDQSRVAVLPFEAPAGDDVLSLIAMGLTADLIDELAQYPALSVVSLNGVRPFAGASIAPDSIAQMLGVGSVVTGALRRVGDSVRVSVRLVDGRSNMQLAQAQGWGRMGDLLSVRSQVIDSVTNFLRRALGKTISSRDRQALNSPEAWELVVEARSLLDGELRNAMSLTTAERASRFGAVEQLLVRAATLDPQWPTPLVQAGMLLLRRADIEQVAAFSGPSGTNAESSREPADLQSDPKRFREAALRYAEAALARNPTNTEALHLRGRTRMALWENSRALDASALRLSAEADLRRAVGMRHDMAGAWNDLSILLQRTGDYAGSADAARSALDADAFLERPEIVLNRLAFTSLASGRVADARMWCARGQARFPDDARFWGCDLTIIGWLGHTGASLDTAWRFLAMSEERDTLNLLATGWGTRRMLVAAVAARAGLRDSAQSIVARVRARPATAAAALQNDYSEAYVQTLLGNHDRAIELLDRYLAANPSLRTLVRNTPWFTSLRGDSQFVALTVVR